ncbi:type II secretion system F family protein [Paenibacillus sp. OV219]|uniref:type II secretion system F family protein n=1 Tax=Paenibacillus sp. OV219 TaxID=1884377 RepID=UPI0008B3FC01|nr:type II secretion system F family protein [Paenibacillus sp. OV219]SEO67799.1 Flp pilus assembly protein TadB [Paenibacillus sp. OV219]
MLRFGLIAFTIALFGCMYVVFRGLLGVWLHHQQAAGRLNYKQDQRLQARIARYLEQFERPHRHLSELLESLHLEWRISSVAGLSLLLLLVGVSFGALFFQSLKGSLMLGGLLISLPYMTLRSMLTRRQMKTRVDFLPAVELFYQCCLVSGGRQIRAALQRTVEEKRLLGPMQAVFEQLYRNVSVRGDHEASLRIFAASLGHVWADYFVNIVRAGLAEGHPIAANLKDLIIDMRKARIANQQERNKLLEIRIANFSPVFFLILFLGINFHYNAGNAYQYYIADQGGRNMLLNAAVMIFCSFVMGLWLSRKKM